MHRREMPSARLRIGAFHLCWMNLADNKEGLAFGFLQENVLDLSTIGVAPGALGLL